MKTLTLATLGVALLTLASTTAAGPATCADPCEVSGGSLGYVPPVQVIDSGTTVHWVPTDGNAHWNMDTAQACFSAPFGPGHTMPVRFEIVDGTLQATADPSDPNATASTCTGALALPDGSFEVTYFCILHPVLMKGSLVVQPA